MRLVLALVCLTAAGAAALSAGPEAFGRLALDLGVPKLALPLLGDPHARGVALYAAGDYAGADRAFAEAGRAATYDRGLTLAATGEYALALAYFEAVLFVAPATPTPGIPRRQNLKIRNDLSTYHKACS